MDTLAISEKLIASGVPEAQAKAHAMAIREAAEESAKESAQDLVTNAVLRAELAEMKADMMRFSIIVALGTLTLQTGLIAILLMLFHNAPK